MVLRIYRSVLLHVTIATIPQKPRINYHMRLKERQTYPLAKSSQTETLDESKISFLYYFNHFLIYYIFVLVNHSVFLSSI